MKSVTKFVIILNVDGTMEAADFADQTAPSSYFQTKSVTPNATTLSVFTTTTHAAFALMDALRKI